MQNNLNKCPEKNLNILNLGSFVSFKKLFSSIVEKEKSKFFCEAEKRCVKILCLEKISAHCLHA